MKLIQNFLQKKEISLIRFQEEAEFKLKKGKQVFIANNVDQDRPDSAGKIEELDPGSAIIVKNKGEVTIKKINKKTKHQACLF